MTPDRRIVDVDDVGTWPKSTVRVVDQWVAKLRGTAESTCDLPLDLEPESEFRALLGDRLVRAYHCTRLLPHEAETVRKRGLLPLSEELVRDRIEGAQTAGAISSALAAQLHRGHVFAAGKQGNREGQVCFVLSLNTFEYDPQACEPLLATWGGEGIYMASGRPSILGSIGTPTIVSALLDLRDSQHLLFPSLHKVFVGARLRLADYGADVFYRSPVPPERVEGMWHAGQREYDRFHHLPAL